MSAESSLHSAIDTQEKADLFVKHLQPKRIGVYAGSFNPFHLGHLNIVQKAKELFDEVVVLKAVNPEKDGNPKFVHHYERLLEPIKEALRRENVEVQYMREGYLITRYIADLEYLEQASVTLIRGLRNGKDLDYEQNQLYYLQRLKKDLKTVYLICDPEFQFISSSAIRNLQKLKGNNSSDYLP